MRVLVCGSRDWRDPSPIHGVLNGYQADGFGVVVINGGALGADRFARHWAERNEEPCETYPADWGTNGKAAGPIRNGQMLRDGRPEVVWAFVTKPLEESRGTADMVRRARDAGIPTYVVSRP